MQILVANSDSIDEAVAVLRTGGTVIHATETCYGITCDLANPAAVQKLFDCKKRPYDQPVSALFSSLAEAKTYVVFSPRALELAEKHLPGPLTLVLPKKDITPTTIYVCTPTPPTTIGVRLSPHPIAQALARAFGKPIATTSANLHGKPNPYTLSDLLSQFTDSASEPDRILDSGSLPVAPPSTVVAVIDDQVRVIRQGDVVV